MKFPLIVEEHGDLLVFRDEQTACQYLEPIDVANNEYAAFDSDGDEIELGIEKTRKSSRFAGTTTVEKVVVRGKTGVNLEPKLSRKIFEYLESVGMTDVERDMPLQKLISILDLFLND